MDHVLTCDHRAVLTPAGTPLVTRHRELAMALLEDLRRWGPDPRRQFSMLSLQATHLDFAPGRSLNQFVSEIAAAAPSDPWVSRPGFPTLEVALADVWGTPERLEPALLRATLAALTPRQITAVILGGTNLNSPLLALHVVTSAARLEPLAVGACGLFYEALRSRVTPSGLASNALEQPRSRRRTPDTTSTPTCTACCAGAPAERTEATCDLLRAVAVVRRFAALPEEPPAWCAEMQEYLLAAAEAAADETSAPRTCRRSGCQCEAHFWLGSQLAEQGRLREAIREYHQATELCDDNGQAWLYLGNCQFNCGQAEEALESLDRALALLPESGLAAESKANVLNAMDRDEEAALLYERALALDPTCLRSHLELARHNINLRQFERSLQHAEAATKLDPDHWYAHAKRGHALHLLGRSDDALEPFRRALELDDTSAETWANYALALEATKDLTGARQAIGRALRLAPQSSWVAETAQRLQI